MNWRHGRTILTQGALPSRRGERPLRKCEPRRKDYVDLRKKAKRAQLRLWVNRWFSQFGWALVGRPCCSSWWCWPTVFTWSDRSRSPAGLDHPRLAGLASGVDNLDGDHARDPSRGRGRPGRCGWPQGAYQQRDLLREDGGPVRASSCCGRPPDDTRTDGWASLAVSVPPVRGYAGVTMVIALLVFWLFR